jgi:hypothetical protein
MSFKFIEASATGNFQTLFNRLIEDPETIDLTTDTAGPNSSQAIPFDGIDDSVRFNNIILVQNIGTSGASAENIAFDGFIKNDVATASQRLTWFDASIMRSESAMVSGFDGIYSSSIVLSSDNKKYVEFRIHHGELATEYSLTSDTSIDTTSWHHIWCEYASGAQEMRIYIDTATAGVSSQTISSLTDVASVTPLGARGVSFGGRLDELRLWIATGSASAIGKLGGVTGIDSAPEDIAILNEFQPSADTLAAWWKFDTVSAIQLFSSVSGSIIDSTVNGHIGTPSGFKGSDIISSETTIVSGVSASGDLKNILGGSLDHGGLTISDPGDGKIKFDSGSENLINEVNNSWIATGASVVVTVDDNNIFYGASGVKINTNAINKGAYQDISNSALLFVNNTYTCSFRYRVVSGSSSAQVNFKLGDTLTSITAHSNLNTWKPIIIRNTVAGTATGRIEVLTLSESLIQIDGLQVIEGDYPATFIGPSRIRKSSQVVWPVID